MPNRPNPEGWKGGSEDFETTWTLFGNKVVPQSTQLTEYDIRETAKLNRNHGRLTDHEGFGGA